MFSTFKNPKNNEITCASSDEELNQSSFLMESLLCHCDQTIKLHSVTSTGNS
jgi:hypothetical protein